MYSVDDKWDLKTKTGTSHHFTQQRGKAGGGCPA